MPGLDNKKELLESFDSLEQRVKRLIELFVRAKEENERLKKREVEGKVVDRELKEVLGSIKDKIENLIDMLTEIGI